MADDSPESDFVLRSTPCQGSILNDQPPSPAFDIAGRSPVDFSSVQVGMRTQTRPVRVTARCRLRDLVVQGGAGATGVEFPWIPAVLPREIAPGMVVQLGEVAFHPRGFGDRSHSFTLRASDPNGGVVEQPLRLTGVGLHPRRLSVVELSTGVRDDFGKEGRHYFVVVSDPEEWAPAAAMARSLGLHSSYVTLPLTTREGRVGFGYSVQPGELLLDGGVTMTGAPAALLTAQIQYANPEWLSRTHTVVSDAAIIGQIDTALRECIFTGEDAQPPTRDGAEPALPATGSVWRDRSNGRIRIVISSSSGARRLWAEGGLKRRHLAIIVSGVLRPSGRPGGDLVVSCPTGDPGLQLTALPCTARMEPLKDSDQLFPLMPLKTVAEIGRKVLPFLGLGHV